MRIPLLVASALCLTACATALTVGDVTPRPPIEKQPFTVDVRFQNTGKAPTSGNIEADIGGEHVVSPVNALTPGQSTLVTLAVPGLPRGLHTARIAYREQAGNVRSQTTHPIEVEAATRQPRYNEVFQTATHNSFWVKRDNVVEVHATGTEHRLLDQLLFEHVRTLELDIHKAGPGDWEVYHNEPVIKFLSNSLCGRLEDCLRHLELFHHALPQHEPVTVILELKDFDSPNFDDSHTVQQLDALIERRLGAALFRPRDMFARCPPNTPRLRDCVGKGRWPTVEELRGRFIFVVLGNWRGKADHTFNYYGQGGIGWVRYATDAGGVKERVAFPMATDFAGIQESETGYGAEWRDAFVTVPTGFLTAACEESIFLQSENGMDHPWHCGKARDLMARGVVVRMGGPDGVPAQPSVQAQRISEGVQLLQTDHPWQVHEDKGPLQPLRVLPGAGFPAGTRVYEPGARLLFSSTQPLKQTRVFSYVDAGDGDWTALVSVTRPSTQAAFANPAQPRGMGCLRAQAGSREPNDNRADHFAVCRMTRDGEHARISVELSVNGEWRGGLTFDADPRASNGIGELLRLSVRGRCVEAQSASEAPGGTPAWHKLASHCFSEPLTRQGLTADSGDVLFAGIRRTDAAGRPLAARGSTLTGPVLLGTFGQPLQPAPGSQAYTVRDVGFPLDLTAPAPTQRP